MRALLGVCIVLVASCGSPTTSVAPKDLDEKPFILESESCFVTRAVEEEVEEILSCETYIKVVFYDGSFEILPAKGYIVREHKDHKSIVPEPPCRGTRELLK